MDSGRFSEELELLARGFRKNYGFPKLHQVGLVVSELLRCASTLEKRGIGPFFLARGSPILWKERGEVKGFSGAMGLAFYQGYELELLEPGEGSDFYRRSLDPEGRIVLHHLGFLVRDVDQWSERLEKDGYPVWVRGKIKTGPILIDFAYMDTLSETGLVIEFISWRFLGVKFSPFAGLIHFLGKLEKWSRKRLIEM